MDISINLINRYIMNDIMSRFMEDIEYLFGRSNELYEYQYGTKRIDLYNVVRYLLKNEINGEYIKECSDIIEEKQLQIVMKNVENVQYIYFPTEKVQLHVIKQNSNNLKYIDNQKETIQMKIVIEYPESVQYIKECYDTVFLELCEKSLFHGIEEPTCFDSGNNIARRLFCMYDKKRKNVFQKYKDELVNYLVKDLVLIILDYIPRYGLSNFVRSWKQYDLWRQHKKLKNK